MTVNVSTTQPKVKKETMSEANFLEQSVAVVNGKLYSYAMDKDIKVSEIPEQVKTAISKKR